MIPTDEQEQALGLYLSGESFAIEAGAGTGKTSTLTLIGEEGRSFWGQYVAFNRAAVLDARRKMPLTVYCSTAHSLAAVAMRDMRPGLLERLGAPRRPSWQTARDLRLHKAAATLRVGGRLRVLQPGWLAGHVMRALLRFCQSADLRPGVEHFEMVPTLDEDMANPVNNLMLAESLLPVLDRAWLDVTDPDGKLRFEHDHYLKAWALTGPKIDGDFVLVDEAQDLNPVMQRLLGDQDCQVVWVGDSQQQIYEWRGAINALAHIDADLRTFLTLSFRFGQPIADLANLVLGELGAELRLRGHPEIDSGVGTMLVPWRTDERSAVLCRTNAVAVERVLDLQQRDVPVHLVGGGREVLDFAWAAQRLQETGRCQHRELACFDSWRAVREFVAEDPLGAELRLLVDLVDRFGAEKIIEALDDMLAEDHAQVIVSTAHKAKGREWSTVQIASDFPTLDESSPADLRLLYVAATRARTRLDYRFCQALRCLAGDNNPMEVPT